MFPALDWADVIVESKGVQFKKIKNGLKHWTQINWVLIISFLCIYFQILFTLVDARFQHLVELTQGRICQLVHAGSPPTSGSQAVQQQQTSLCLGSEAAIFSGSQSEGYVRWRCGHDVYNFAWGAGIAR